MLYLLLIKKVTDLVLLEYLPSLSLYMQWRLRLKEATRLRFIAVAKKYVLLNLNVNVKKVGFNASNIVTILAVIAEIPGNYKKV